MSTAVTFAKLDLTQLACTCLQESRGNLLHTFYLLKVKNSVQSQNNILYGLKKCSKWFHLSRIMEIMAEGSEHYI